MPFLLCLCLSLSVSPQEPVDRWFAEDKAKHFLTSFAATTISAGAARMLGVEARGREESFPGGRNRDPGEALSIEVAAQRGEDVVVALLPELTQAVEAWVTEGVEAAMNRFNR